MGPPAMSTITRRALCSNEESEVRKGPWTLKEDNLLIQYIAHHGEGRWNMLAKMAGLKRTGKSCRLRWLNYLKPDIKRGNLTPQEQLLILELHSKWGNRWSKIAQHLPGRTDNEIKNYWRTRVQKQARQLNIKSGSKGFIDAMKCFWAPRLLEKMEQDSSPGYFSSLTNMNFGDSAEFSMSTSSNLPYLSASSSQQSQFIDVGNHFSTLSSTINPSYDCLQFSQLLENSAPQTSPPHVFEYNLHFNPFQDGCYVGHTNSNGMEGLNLDPMLIMGTHDIPQFDVQTAQSDRVLENMGYTLWNMDAM